MDNMNERGATEDEVRRVLEQGRKSDARPPRLAREMVFTEGYERRGRFYPHKLVKVIYAWERRNGDAIVVVTVLVFYGRWRV